MTIPKKAEVVAKKRQVKIAKIMQKAEEAIQEMSIPCHVLISGGADDGFDDEAKAEIKRQFAEIDPSYQIEFKYLQGKYANERTGWVMYIK